MAGLRKARLRDLGLSLVRTDDTFVMELQQAIFGVMMAVLRTRFCLSGPMATRDAVRLEVPPTNVHI